MVTHTIPSTVLIHSLMAEIHNAANLWYLCRAVDVKGVGNVILNLDQIKEVLGVSESTVRRWLKDEQGTEDKPKRTHNFFRRYKWLDKKTVHIFYQSLERVAFINGYEGFGRCVEMDISVLYGRTLKIHATEIEAISLQRQSQYLAAKQLREEKGIKKPKLPDANEIIHGSSDICSGALHGERRFTLVDREKFPRFGGSQKGIAKRMCRNPATIRKRLSHFYRDSKGLPILYKTQVCVISKLSKKEFKVKRSEHIPMPRRWIMADCVWEGTTNLYWDDGRVFHPKKYRRKGLKQLWKKVYGILPSRNKELNSGGIK